MASSDVASRRHASADTPLLSARAVALAYNGQPPLLSGFDFDLWPGERVALLGHSGVGKSSLLRVLAGLQRPAAGLVEMEGQPLRRVHPRLAVAFQAPALLPWLSVEKNVAFGLDFARQPHQPPAQRQASVTAALEAVGLASARHLKPSALSGGMAQRVALARCLARQPQVLLLDEPFGALDEVTRADMQQLLLRVTADHGTATVLITHDIDEALLVSDRVLLLGGRPAGILGEWRIGLTHPRDHQLETLGALRIEILHTLRQSMRRPAEADSSSPAQEPPHVD